jgi:hypothetical protein
MITHTKTYEAPPIRRREILRYAGCAEADAATALLMEDCLTEAADALTYKVCYRELPVKIDGEKCDFGTFSVFSHQLARNLENCTRVILLAATVGVGIDRLIQKYSRIAPSRALMMQAIGAERIEALCDAFCDDTEKEMGVSLRPRFSPGYGDLPLSVQKDIISLLEAPKRIGLSLNDSLLMSPTKSVTAFAGITNSTE